MDLRDEIARMVATWDDAYTTPLGLADAILALPDIHDRLYCDCGRERAIGACTGFCDNDE